MSEQLSRDDLIALCEAASRPQSVWHDRDSASAQRQVGEAWALLRAGCDFEIAEDMEDFGGKTIWVRITFEGFNYFEVGSVQRDVFYLPARKRLDAAGEDDWY